MNEEFKRKYPNYMVTPDGAVYKNGYEMKPFKSNKYLQVLLYDVEHNRHIFGVHTLVAMVYLSDFYFGCIVHHKDGNTHNNSVDNLEIMSQSEHAQKHGKVYCACAEYNKKYGSWNKGKHMTLEQRKHLSNVRKGQKFKGNQYVDAYGNRK